MKISPWNRGVGVLAGLVLAGWGAAGAVELKPSDDWVFDLNGEVRLRGEARNDNDLSEDIDDDRREGLQRIRLGFAIRHKDRVRVFIQAQDSRVWGAEEEPEVTDPTTANSKNLDLHQGYVEVSAFGKSHLTLYAGRREWNYGDQRLIGSFGWSNVGRSFDGVTLRWQGKKTWLDGFYGRVDQEILKETIPATMPPGQMASATRGDFLAGVYAQWRTRDADQWEAYFLDFSDSAEAAGEVTGEDGATSVKAYGARAKSGIGRFDYTAEVVLQGGTFNGDDHDALAVGAQLGLTLGEAKRWRVHGGYDFATGDADSTDGEHEEFFNFFPTNHLPYGYMDLFGWRNLKSPWAGLAWTAPRHKAQARVFRFELDEPGGRWSNAGGTTLGFDPAGGSGTKVGREIDLTYSFKWTDQVAVEANVSRFEPDDFAEATRGDAPSHFGYLQLTVTF